MKPFGKLMDRIKALNLIEKNLKQINRTEIIPLEKSIGRILATDIIANFNVPPFNRASMDGYAVIADDTQTATEKKPVKLKLMGVLHAGKISSLAIKKGECMEISTGSPIPSGGNAVVMVEYTSRDGKHVLINRKVNPNDNIAPIGEDIKKGDHVIKKGAMLTPGKIGAIAALGLSKIEVIQKPRIAIFSSGSEIVPLGQQLKMGQIYDINSYTLIAIIKANGCIPVKRGIMEDTYASIEASLKDASNYDLGVFSGGSSVGSKDLLSDVMEKLGKIHFHGLKVKPGKPTLFGQVFDTPIFGMPGYPTSCLNNSYVYLQPAIRKLAGIPPKNPRVIKVPMGHRLHAKSDREQFITVKLDNMKAYRVFKKSGNITSMTNADGYIIIPTQKNSIEKGELVKVTLLE
jgi:molybdenum cofactor synthesis domain-containing protein